MVIDEEIMLPVKSLVQTLQIISLDSDIRINNNGVCGFELLI